MNNYPCMQPYLVKWIFTLIIVVVIINRKYSFLRQKIESTVNFFLRGNLMFFYENNNDNNKLITIIIIH